jgi:hypothetical protein
VSTYDGVYPVNIGKSRLLYLNTDKSPFLCLRCYNKSIAEVIGLDFDHVSFDPITLVDKEGKNHTFRFQTRLFGFDVHIQAREFRNDVPKGYVFSIHGNAEDDQFELFSKLVEHMRRAMERQHIVSIDSSDLFAVLYERNHPAIELKDIKISGMSRYDITDKGIVRGHIAWDNGTDAEVPCLVIDGKELSWNEFGRMLMMYEGLHFKLEIFDGSEER